MNRRFLPFFLLVATAFAQKPAVSTDTVRAHMEFLASDALGGRGSATNDEHIAAEYIASELRAAGVKPGLAQGFIQEIALVERKLSAAPYLDANGTRFTHGAEALVLFTSAREVFGPLTKHTFRGGTALPKLDANAVVFTTEDLQRDELFSAAQAVAQAGGAAVITSRGTSQADPWGERGKRMPRMQMQFKDATAVGRGIADIIAVTAETASRFKEMAGGAPVRLVFPLDADTPRATWNVIGMLPGTNPNEVVLLSAHLDHLGTRPGKPGEDNIYNGADDDATGVTAVLELARALAAGPKLRRTVYFVLFGSEEQGGHGSRWFREHPPVPLTNIVANLQFEMLGRPDAAIGSGKLWMTGFDRSDLGPALAQHGAALVADPHPEQDFFQRSDNYPLAQKGVVAHGVSSFGLHHDYHQPSDDVSKIDFDHLTAAIQKMVEPVRWLSDSEFVPKWLPGKKP